MNRLLKYFKGYYGPSILAPLFKLIEALLELAVPMIVASIIDQAIPSGQQGQVLAGIAWMFAFAFLGLVFADSAQYLSAKASVGFTKQMNQDLFAKIVNLDAREIQNQSSSSLVNRMTADSLQVQTGLNIFFRLFLRSPFIVFGAFVMALSISSRVTWIFLGMIVALFLAVGLVVRLSNPRFTLARERLDRLVLLARQQVKGVRVIRAFGRQADEEAEFVEANQSLYQTNLQANNVSVLSNPLTYTIVNLSLILILWQGGGWVDSGLLKQGELVALVNYLLSILVELVKLAMVVSTMIRTYTSTSRISQVLALEEEGAAFDFLPVEQEDNLIEAQNLSFAFDEKAEPVLSDLNFALRSGSFLGVIGSTGSGKSVLMSLLMKNYDPTGGRLRLNSHRLKVGSRKEWRQGLSLVSQRASLFKGTVRSNLLLANPQASDEEMWQALDVAQAASFVKEKEGLDTPVTTFGRNFSGGQRQRLTLARALLKPAEIYIFDDSTSALDYLTESEFQKALKTHYRHKTIVMVSQRTGSVKEADQILVLEEGQQVGYGRHEMLLETSEVYREIHESQEVKEVGK